MEMGLLTAFWAISFSLVLTPGADWAYAISAGLRDRAIMPAVSGMLLGYLAITLVVAAGVGALVAGVPAVLTVLTVLGAGYLLWLGVGVLAHPPVPVADEDQAARSWTGCQLCADLLACRHGFEHGPQDAPARGSSGEPVLRRGDDCDRAVPARRAACHNPMRRGGRLRKLSPVFLRGRCGRRGPAGEA